MRHLYIFIFSLFFINPGAHSQTFYKGVDISFAKELEGCGVQWKDNGSVKEIFSIFKDNGANLIRIRIFHTPVSGKNGYDDAEVLISRAKAKGFKVMLDFFYSDTWADAGTQKCPAAWLGVVNNNAALADSVYNYTKKVLQTLKGKSLMPEFVQVGNETNGGMCFPGTGTVTWPTDWTKQTLLFNAGIKAVHDVDATTKVILHVADPKNAEWWAGQLNSNSVTGYDILGISFYPVWHTTVSIVNFGTVITNIKNTYSKDVMVVETGLPWTNGYDDNTTNVMNGVPNGFGTSPTPEIQANWLTDLYNTLKTSGGTGIVYWEPEWVASHATNCPSDFGGSTWENITLFDFDNNLMTNGGIKFYQLATGVNYLISGNSNNFFSVFPNPAKNELNIQFMATGTSEVSIEITDLQGRTVRQFRKNATFGADNFQVDISDPSIAPGLYVLHIKSRQISENQKIIITR